MGSRWLLAEGVRNRNFGAYLLVAFVSSGLAGGLGMLQPALLQLMEIPAAEQGNVTGTLGLVQEVIFIASTALYGVLSDRIGRRPVYVFGLLVAAAGYGMYPRAGSVDELMVYRALYAVGGAATLAMLVAVISDYAAPGGRGRANGIQGFIMTLGAFIPIVLVGLPKLFVERGASQLEAQQYAFLCTTAMALVAAAVAQLGLVGHKPVHRATQTRSLTQMAREGLAAARDPGVALSYGAAFISRGDLAVTGSFLILWLTQHGTQELGLDPAQAQRNAVPLVMMTVFGGLFGSVVIGVLADRIDRVTAVVMASGVGAIVYSAMFFVQDPTADYVKGLLLVMGVAELSGFVTSQALVGQRAPAQVRGSVVGLFSTAGAFGILTGTWLGGKLFSSFGPSTPFVMFGLLNLIVCVWGLRTRRRIRHQSAQARSDQPAEIS